MNYKERLVELNKERENLYELIEKEAQEKHLDNLKLNIGRYFKYEKNLYDKKYFVYYKIKDIIPDSICENDHMVSFYCIAEKFCQKPDGEITIHKSAEIRNFYLRIEIDESEYYKAQKQVLEIL